LFRDNEHVNPDGAEMVIASVLLKPLSAVKVTVEFPRDPALTVTLVGLAAIVKSTTSNVTVELWANGPLVLPTITMLFEKVEKVQVRLTLAEVVVDVKVTLGTVRLHAVPPFWKIPMVPVKPLTAVTRIVELPGDPAFTISAVGFAMIV
jgi:hypothetical protein